MLCISAPSTAPTITDVSAPTPSVISISWRPPIFPNGKVLGYRLKLNPYEHPELPLIQRDVPGNVTSWTIPQLQSSQLYLITLSTWNIEGEGPVDSANITTPNPGNCKSLTYSCMYWLWIIYVSLCFLSIVKSERNVHEKKN